jgi:hypothetical protein
MLDKTLRPANVVESREFRNLLKKHGIAWRDLYRDEGKWVIAFSKHAEPPDISVLEACEDWEFVASGKYGGTLLVWVRLPEDPASTAS